MKYSEIINKLHTGVVIYLLFGWTLKSQRELLVLLIPTVQFQFLVNDNQCILTQLEKKCIVNENNETKEIVYESFVDAKLKQYNIHIGSSSRELIINGSIYASFALSYFLM